MAVGTSPKNGHSAFPVSFLVVEKKHRLMSVFPAVNCTEPPEKPGAGTWEWNGELIYETEILYTCGPYGNFLRFFH